MLSVHSLNKNSKIVKYHPPFKSFDQFLEKLSRKYKGKAAVVFEDVDKNTSYYISYNDLNVLTRNLAQTLINKWRLKKGESFSFSLTNTPEVIILNFAAWRAGLVTVPLDPRRDTLERKIYKLKLTESKLLFTDSARLSQKEKAMSKKENY